MHFDGDQSDIEQLQAVGIDIVHREEEREGKEEKATESYVGKHHSSYLSSPWLQSFSFAQKARARHDRLVCEMFTLMTRNRYAIAGIA